MLGRRQGVHQSVPAYPGVDEGNESAEIVRIPTLARGVSSRGSHRAKAAVITADAVAISIAMTLAAWFCALLGTKPEGNDALLLVGVVSLPLWLGIFARYRLYTTAAVTSFPAEFSRVIHAVIAATACTGLVEIVLAVPISRAWLLLVFVTALVTVLVERTAIRLLFRRARTRGRLKRRVVVIGTNPEALAVVRMLESDHELGYDVVGLLDSGTAYGVIAPVPVLGQWNEAVEIMDEVNATGVIIAASAIDVPLANRLARQLMERGYHVELTSGLVDIAANRLITRPLGRRAVMYVEPARRVGWKGAAKRGFDIVCASTLLLLAAPILIAAAIAIKLDSPGPVFFRQQRLGKNRVQFGVLKLRTMVSNAEQMLDELRAQNDLDGPLFKMRDDPRVTRVGRFLRTWSIDELPQLWNVLRGEMSIVGPRPALPSEVVGWPEDLLNRLLVRPGITGMWQVHGRSTSSFDDYERYDLYYVDNWSLLADLAIILRTIPVVLLRKGAF
jgi:exopolysaccharide biosynthesis polyprenyl glycosylphosphotransferase